MEGLIFGLVENLLSKLSSRVYQEISSAFGVRNDLKELTSTITTVKAVLADAEAKRIQNNEVNIWLEQLKDVLYDAEDVFNEFECEALRNKLMNRWRTSKKVICFLPMQFNNSIIFNFKMAPRIEAIRNRLDKIASQRQNFHLIEKEIEHFPHTVRDMTHSFIHESEVSWVIGRDYDRKRIIELLIHSNHDKELSIISLVGMGGLGKTTLSKLVYNDERVDQYFQKKMWVCVSTDFDVQRLTREILSSVNNSEISENLTLDQLQSKLREKLVGQSFLLVLDDVWNENANKWRDLRQFLMVGARGSKILVTTRMDSVAHIMSSNEKHELRGISKKDSWLLFAKCVSHNGKEEEIPCDLMKIGEEILRKCKGVPLAIRSLGSLLYSKTSVREWEYIRDSELWKVEDKREDGILPALKLSYKLMPSYLKPCFVYCALFPKDYVYSSHKMIGLWMAQDMLHPESEIEELEDVGKRYIEELGSRSFFQNFRKNPSIFDLALSNEELFQMHDLIHDLALSIAQDKYLTVESSTDKSILKNEQHLYFSADCNWLDLQPSKRVRSFIFSRRIRSKDFSEFDDKNITKFKFLRALELCSIKLKKLPHCIGRMKHLKYLNVKGNSNLKKLPNSICELQSLQTLNLDNCGKLEALPKGMGNLISLRCLWINGTLMSELTQQSGIEWLMSNLRFLVIGHSSPSCTLSQSLSEISSRRKVSEIKNIVIHQSKLHTLRLQDLSWVALPQWFQNFARTLRDFQIVQCDLRTLPEWLPNLSSLESLEIRECRKLSSLPKGMEKLTSIRKLTVKGCGKLSRRCAEDFGDQRRMIAHIPQLVTDQYSFNSYYYL